MEITLQHALLRRKELDERIRQMQPFRDRDFFEQKIQRRRVDEGIDEVAVAIPKMTWTQFNAEFNFLQKQRRIIDGVIQQANWETKVDDQGAMQDWVEPDAPTPPEAS